MKLQSKIKHALALAALAPMLIAEGCTCSSPQNGASQISMKAGKIKSSPFMQDSPRKAHTLQELAAEWQWETHEGDAATGFAVAIEQASDNEIRIINFLNIGGEAISAQVCGDSLFFNGELAGGNLLIQNGKGNITDGWTNILLEYDTFDGEEREHQKALLSRGTII